MRPPAFDPGAWLSGAELGLFFGQAAADQRHAVRVACHLLAGGHADRLIIQAALLHDLGKADARIGLWQRVAWVVVLRLMPSVRVWLVARGGAWRVLADHAAIGAARLQAAGSDWRLVSLVGGRALPGDEHRAALLAAADDAV